MFLRIIVKSLSCIPKKTLNLTSFCLIIPNENVYSTFLYKFVVFGIILSFKEQFLFQQLKKTLGVLP